MSNLHKNNLAEWIMLIAIFPFVWIRRMIHRPRMNTFARDAESAEKREET
jgi:hypothetical protein